MKTKLKSFFSPIETKGSNIRYTFSNFMSTPQRWAILLVLLSAITYTIVVGNIEEDPLMVLAPLMFLIGVLTVFTVMTLNNWQKLKNGKKFIIDLNKDYTQTDTSESEENTEDIEHSLPPRTRHIRSRYFMFVYSWSSEDKRSGRGNLFVTNSSGEMTSMDFIKTSIKTILSKHNIADLHIVLENVIEFNKEDFDKLNKEN